MREDDVSSFFSDLTMSTYLVLLILQFLAFILLIPISCVLSVFWGAWPK